MKGDICNRDLVGKKIYHITYPRSVFDIIQTNLIGNGWTSIMLKSFTLTVGDSMAAYNEMKSKFINKINIYSKSIWFDGNFYFAQNKNNSYFIYFTFSYTHKKKKLEIHCCHITLKINLKAEYNINAKYLMVAKCSICTSLIWQSFISYFRHILGFKN